VAVYERLDGDLDQRRRLRRRQLVDRRLRISAAEKGPDEIRHVAADSFESSTRTSFALITATRAAALEVL
jgi:hypothetical protein